MPKRENPLAWYDIENDGELPDPDDLEDPDDPRSPLRRELREPKRDFLDRAIRFVTTPGPRYNWYVGILLALTVLGLAYRLYEGIASGAFAP